MLTVLSTGSEGKNWTWGSVSGVVTKLYCFSLFGGPAGAQ